MILNFHQISKITKLSLLIFAFCAVFFSKFVEDGLIYAQAVAQNLEPTKEQSLSKQIDHFLKSLIKASKDESIMIFGRYRDMVASQISLDKLYSVSYKDVEILLNQAVSQSIDSLTLFSHPLLQDQNCFAIVFDERLLGEINNNFDFHALFNISILSVDGPTVKMKFFVIGQGKVIVGYNRNAKIRHPDYNFATGLYDYKELFIMDAKKGPEGSPGLFNIKGISDPNEPPQWMKGPLNADIHSMIITSDAAGRKQILIQYDLFGIKHKLLWPIPIEKLYRG